MSAYDPAAAGDYAEHARRMALTYKPPPRYEAPAPHAESQPDTRPEWQMSDAERDRARRSQSEQPPYRRGSWPSAEYELARLKARAEAEAKYAEELAGPDDAWMPSALTSAEPVPEPSILRVEDGPSLLRRGEVTLVSGLPGSAKTPLAYLGVVEPVQRGETVLIIDHEMHQPRAVALLREVGLSDAQIDAQVIHYDDPPPLTARTQERVIETCAGRDVSYVVIDALAGSMPSGTSQNDAADVDAWFASTPKWLAAQFNAAVLVIDHSNKGDGPEPGGSVRKQGVPDLRMWLRLDKGFSKSNEEGRSTLIVQRDRSGTYGKGETVAELRNELREGRSVFVLREADKTTSVIGDEVDLDFGAMPATERFALDKLEDLRQYGAEGVMQSTFTGGGAGRADVVEALERLKKQGLAASRPSGRNNTGTRWWAAEFLSKEDD